MADLTKYLKRARKRKAFHQSNKQKGLLKRSGKARPFFPEHYFPENRDLSPTEMYDFSLLIKLLSKDIMNIKAVIMVFSLQGEMTT